MPELSEIPLSNGFRQHRLVYQNGHLAQIFTGEEHSVNVHMPPSENAELALTRLAFGMLGLTRQEIAPLIGIAEGTIANSRSKAFIHLDAINLPHAVTRAFDSGVFAIANTYEPLAIRSEDRALVHQAALGWTVEKTARALKRSPSDIRKTRNMLLHTVLFAPNMGNGVFVARMSGLLVGKALQAQSA